MNKTLWIILSVICFLLGAFVYTGSHIEQVQKIGAEYQLTKGNIPKALNLYENAFEMGLKDSKSREKYVDLIIKGPIEAKYQEKLYKFLEINIEDESKVKAEQYLEGLKEDIRNKYPDTYIKQAPFNHKIMRWGKLPIKYGFLNKNSVPDYYSEQIINAFNSWEERTQNTVVFHRDDNDPEILIKFSDLKEQIKNPDAENEKYIIAYTNPIISGNDLIRMDIEFFVQTVDGEYFTEHQIYNTALHEICHALGFMGHSDRSKDVLYMSVHPVVTSNDLKIKLSDRDIATLKLLYSIKPEISNMPNVKSSYASQLILGDELEISNAKIKEAREYILKAPNIPNGYVDLAEGLVATKKYSKAIKYLEKALTLTSDVKIIEMIYYNLALTYHFIDDNEHSIYYLDKAIALNDSTQYHQLLAEIYVSQNNIEAAIKEYEYLIVSEPSNIEYLIPLVNIYVNKHNYYMARKTLKLWLQKNPAEKKNVRLAPYGIIKAFI